MGTKEEARKGIVEARQHNENIQKTMLSRSEAEIDKSRVSEIDEEARELMAKERKHNQHLEQTMLSRSEAEITDSEG